MDEQELMFLPRKKLVENTLAAQVPELFLPYNSRKCARAPRIGSEEEALNSTKIISNIRIPIHLEGKLEPKIYACDHHKRTSLSRS